MSEKNLSRRNFLGKTALGVTGAVLTANTVNSMPTSSYRRIIGANDRINIGFLGCGSRSKGHQNMVQMSAKEKNLGVVAVCDLWNKNRERTAQRCNDTFNTKVSQFQYFEDLLNMPELDAVMIATGDF